LEGGGGGGKTAQWEGETVKWVQMNEKSVCRYFTQFVFLLFFLSIYLSICLSFFLLKNWEWNIFIRHHNLLRSFVLSFETKTLHNREWVRATILKLTLLQHFSFMASFHTSIKMSKSQTQTVTSCKKWVSNVYLTFGIRLWSWSLNLTKQQNY
jgi:hypothetical protein